MAVSRPGPGPFTNTATCLTPSSTARLATLADVIWAAKGVPFLVPLKPVAPAEAQHRTAPRSSVMVTIVLLKEDWMKTFAKVTVFQLRFPPALGPPLGPAAGWEPDSWRGAGAAGVCAAAGAASAFGFSCVFSLSAIVRS